MFTNSLKRFFNDILKTLIPRNKIDYEIFFFANVIIGLIQKKKCHFNE